LVGIAGVNLWGFLSDRMGCRKPFLLLAFVAQAVAFTAYLVTINSPTFLLVASLAQLFTAAVVPLSNAFLTEAQAQRGRAVGGLLAASSLGWFFGAAGGSLLYESLAMQGPFLLGALTSLAGGLILLALTREIPRTATSSSNRSRLLSTAPTSSSTQQRPPHPQNRSEKDMRSPSPWCLVPLLCLAVGLGSMGTNSFGFFFGLYLVAWLGGSPSLLGLAYGSATMTGLAATMITGYASDWVGRRKPFLLAGYASYTIFWLGYSTITDPYLAVLLWAIPLYALVFTASYSAAADSSPPERRGRSMAQVATAFSLGAGIGPTVGGALTQFLTGQLVTAMLLASILNAAALILILTMPEPFTRTPALQTNAALRR